MGMGPVDYMIVAFPGNQFKGEILPALQELTDSDTIRIIDLAMVIKDENGNAYTPQGVVGFRPLEQLEAQFGLKQFTPVAPASEQVADTAA